MNRHLIDTQDGSPSIFSDIFGESYHSCTGAIQESQYLFIDNGLSYFINNHKDKKTINIIEFGFGTGLNTLLTTLSIEKFSIENRPKIYYDTLEKYPLQEDEYKLLNYGNNSIFNDIHTSVWERYNEITDNFFLRKVKCDFLEYNFDKKIDIVYFDPFSPNTQPQIWGIEIFSKIYSAMNSGSIFITYSSKGIVKQALRDVGFNVKRIKGAGNKRHSLLAFK